MRQFTKEVVSAFASEEQKRRAWALLLIIETALAGLVLLLGIRLIFNPGSKYIPVLCVSIFLLVLSCWLLRLKQLDWSTYLFLGTLLTLISYLIAVSPDGYHDTAMFAVPGVLIISGIFLKKWQFYVFTIVTALLIGLLVGAESFGIHTSRYSEFASMFDAVDIIFIITVTAIAIRVLTENLVRSLQRAGENEKALNESEKRLQSLADNVPVGLFRVGWGGTIISFNKPLKNLLCIENQSIANLNACGFYQSQEDRERFSDEITTSGVVNQFECPLVKCNDEVVWVSISANAIYARNDRIEFIDGTVEDITLRKKIESENSILQAQLLQSQKIQAVGTLAGGVAHDFNNILTAILGYTQLAQASLKDPSRVKAHLREVFKASNRAKELVEQILSFSRKKSVRKQEVNIRSSVLEAVQLLRNSIPTTIQIKAEVDTKKCVYANPTQLHQVVMNLGTNAYQAMQDQVGELVIRVSDESFPEQVNIGTTIIPAGNYVQMVVKDNGKGISQEVLQQMFEPFFTTKPVGQGTGLGLSVVHGIVHDHKGFLAVDTVLGSGTCFFVHLPIIGEGLAENVDKEQQLGAQLEGTERILFVDDEESLLDLAELIIPKYGYTIDTFNCPEKALDHLLNSPPYDVIVTDMTMPGMTGVELVQKACAHNTNIKAILCSGYSDLIDLEDAKAKGVDSSLSKPYIMDDLVARMRECLADHLPS